MNIVERIRLHAVKHGSKVALLNPNCNIEKLTYKQLYCGAVKLAQYIAQNVDDRNPIIVYGHKNPYMIVSFLACVMSGHAYCPIDISMPQERVKMIESQTGSGLIISTEEYPGRTSNLLSLKEIISICEDNSNDVPVVPGTMVSCDDTFYIIFTSGSTGVPKGVEITLDDLDNFLDWSATLGDDRPYSDESVFLNQAPFSFDLSVMDLYTSLYCGAALCMMDKSVQLNLANITPFMADNKITTIVSTPSFISMCLVDSKFNAASLASLKSFFFCGETLPNKIAKKLLQRFPNSVIQNTYGPTESTVAVSNVRITQSIVNQFDPLPIGRAKPGTKFIISDGDDGGVGNHIGEILITGNTLAKGYFRRDDLTAKAFVSYKQNDLNFRAYKTGDLGYLDGELLFYNGRIDLQIKLNGYRIEIGDIESSIQKNNIVSNCAVIPLKSGNQIRGLAAAIVLTNKNMVAEECRENIVGELEKLLPSYMVPQHYVFIDELPMTANGKVDRKKLAVLLEEE